jgi:hypothetical protein
MDGGLAFANLDPAIARNGEIRLTKAQRRIINFVTNLIYDHSLEL